ncbi:disease resistance protein RPM1-like [Oryza brachyantha]|uniref:Uncharacterized protein n=1 Tax=Oryza brachyantha TaxID=4533 RepID=J3MYI1_ORYBR|nr:disease resistance protein RPM1-like [Oryza brachyantha]
MAEIVVLFVIKKIGIAVAGETLKLAKPLFANKAELNNAELVTALPVNMKLIKDELEVINAFLKELGTNGCKGELVETWVRQVRRLAHDMEDVVDEFMYVVGKRREKESRAYVKKIIKKPQSLFSLDEIATKADSINRQLVELSKRLGRWTKPILSGSSIPAINYDTDQQLYLPGHDYSINDSELVGIDKNRQTLIESLCLEDCSLRTIAVWGMGGLGKSTLVNNVYKSEAIVSNFNFCAWLSISQSCRVHDIWQNMLKELYGKDSREFSTENMSYAKLKVELTKILDQKRYLIVLDDVWSAADYLKIREVLVDNGLGSRVIITTRIEEVASIAEDGCKISLEPLDDHDAWLLFCRKAFPKIENHLCPPELQQCGMDIIKKCDGLPLALVAIGSLFSFKSKNKKDWRLFYNQLISELHNNENLNQVEKILNLSYKHLPNHLKYCFLYCAMFPEDYLIHRKRLIRFWISEGFIEQKGACSLEDVAEGYLMELVQRSMLQVVARNSFNRIQCLRMHDIVRELAIYQSKRESFCTIYDDTHGVAQLGSDSRRVSVLRCNNSIRPSIDPFRLHTFIAFDTTSMALSSWPAFIPSESKYLSVLDLSGLPIETIPYSVGELFNLRFLCLNDTNVKAFPKSVTKLRNLQTLSLERAQLLNFPRGFSNLKKLRHLLVWKLVDATYKSLNNWQSMEPFEGLWDLKELQHLNEVRATKVFVAKLGNLAQLRSLCITYVRSSHCIQLCNSLSKMHQLTRLNIRASNEHELLLLDDFTLSNPLEKLELAGQLSEGTLESPFFSGHGNKLLRMELSWCQLTLNPVARLAEFSSLTELSLTRVYTGHWLNFHANWFPDLKKLVLWDLQQVKQIFVQEGALANLHYLHIDSLMELRDIPIGIEFLASVKEAYFTRMHSDFVRNLQMGKINHIPKVHWSTQGMPTDLMELADLPGASYRTNTNPEWRILGGSGWVFI